MNREKHLVSKHISQRIKQCLIHEKLSPKNREVRATLGLTGLCNAADDANGRFRYCKLHNAQHSK